MRRLSRSAAATTLLFLTTASGFVCTQPWSDYCPPNGSTPISTSSTTPVGAEPACDPYAAPLPPGTVLTDVRARLVNSLFGRTDGALPSAPPDAVLRVPGNSAYGCTCSYYGTCTAPQTNCSWDNGLSELVFTMTTVVNSTYTLSLNSTVFYTLNTSGIASANYPPNLPPAGPEAPVPATRGRTLVLWHQVWPFFRTAFLPNANLACFYRRNNFGHR